MKLKNLLFILIGLTYFSCNPFKGPTAENKNRVSKFDYYSEQMRVKNFEFMSNGPCDDALEDTVYDRLEIVKEFEQVEDTFLLLEFKFIDACCQNFMGDYTLINDTLKFVIEQVNDEVCSCLCWYRYKLKINNLPQKPKEIKIETK